MEFYNLLRHSRIGRRYISVLYTFICENILPEKKPSFDSINESDTFFNNNQSRVDNVKKLLADERSKNTYEAVIHARRTGDIRCLKYVLEPKPEYFPKDIIHFQDNEVFIDCGAFNGDTIRCLLKLTKKYNKTVKKIYALEPAELSYSDLSFYATKVNKNGTVIVPVKKGAYEKEAVLHLSDNTGVGAHITDGRSGLVIEVISIDTLCMGDDVTFIKMDIEGSEMSALKGASNTILRCHPKLAVCLYHSNEDIIRLAEYIHELVPEYKLYVRQYRCNNCETILYAIP